MKVVLEDNRRFVLRFDKGEEVMGGLAAFFAERQFEAAAFWAIGTAHEIELAYYNPNLKQYRTKPYYDELEIVSLQGTGGILEGKTTVHAHGMFGRNDFSTFGGHVNKIITGATCEVVLIHLDGKLERKNNPDYNLNLLV